MKRLERRFEKLLNSIDYAFEQIVITFTDNSQAVIEYDRGFKYFGSEVKTFCNEESLKEFILELISKNYVIKVEKDSL